MVNQDEIKKIFDELLKLTPEELKKKLDEHKESEVYHLLMNTVTSPDKNSSLEFDEKAMLDARKHYLDPENCPKETGWTYKHAFESGDRWQHSQLVEQNKNLEAQVGMLEKEIKWHIDNGSFVEYELIGGDGAPTGHMPIISDWRHFDKALAKLQQIRDKKDLIGGQGYIYLSEQNEAAMVGIDSGIDHGNGD